MDASIIRLDWYSFLLGTQISAVSGLLTPAPFRFTGRPRLAREYLHPAVHNGGNTIFYFRIQESNNLMRFGTKLLIRVFERNIVGGCLYQLIERYLNVQNATLMTTFTYGGLLGACLSLRCNFYNGFWDTILCGIATGEVAACGEEMRHLMLATNELTIDDFSIPIHYSPMSFFNGAITGCAVALYFADAREYSGYIELPEFDNPTSNMDFVVGYALLIQDVLRCLLKCTLFVTEKLIVGGVLYCGLEMGLRKMTNWKRPFVIVVFCGSALGIYCGIHPALSAPIPRKRVMKAWKLSLIISSCCYISLMSLQKASQYMKRT